MKIFSVKCMVLAVSLSALLNIALGFAAENVSSVQLIGNTKEYDGKQVTYRGEAIGEVMKRGDFAWVNLHDGVNAIGVWVHFSLTKAIIYTGSYKVKGDIIEVSGIFNRACPEHGGDLDIHAKTLRKIEPGRRVEESVNPAKKNLALILSGVLLIVWILTLFLRK